MILLLIIISLLVYFLLTKKQESVLLNPDLKSLLFYRDFLLLTMLPYLYYWYDDKYKEHYILSTLGDNRYFITAALAVFCFLFLFLVSYRFFLPIFNSVSSKFQHQINYKRMVFLLSLLSFLAFMTVTYISYKYNTGVFAFITGISYGEIAEKRHLLSQGSGYLKVNKIFVKSWIPMLSYLFFYLYITKGFLFNRSNKIMMFLSIIAGILASVFFLEKAILFIYLFGFLGVYVYAGGKLKKHYLPISFLLALFVIGIMYILTYGDRVTDLNYIKEIIVHRIATQSVGSVMAFDYFSTHEFKGMSGVSNLWANILNDKFSSPYSDIIKHYVPETAETSGAMSSFVTGEAYGLFGFMGVLMSGFIVALYFSFFEASKRSSVLSILFVGIYGIYFSHPIVASSFYSFVWPVGLFYSILPFILLLLFCIRYDKISKEIINHEK